MSDHQENGGAERTGNVIEMAEELHARLSHLMPKDERARLQREFVAIVKHMDLKEAYAKNPDLVGRYFELKDKVS